jgi:hypothetical protein
VQHNILSLFVAGSTKLPYALSRPHPTNQCTRIAIARFYNGYAPAKKWEIVATIANPQRGGFRPKQESHLSFIREK